MWRRFSRQTCIMDQNGFFSVRLTVLVFEWFMKDCLHEPRGNIWRSYQSEGNYFQNDSMQSRFRWSLRMKSFVRYSGWCMRQCCNRPFTWGNLCLAAARCLWTHCLTISVSILFHSHLNYCRFGNLILIRGGSKCAACFQTIHHLLCVQVIVLVCLLWRVWSVKGVTVSEVYWRGVASEPISSCSHRGGLIWPRGCPVLYWLCWLVYSELDNCEHWLFFFFYCIFLMRGENLVKIVIFY